MKGIDNYFIAGISDMIFGRISVTVDGSSIKTGPRDDPVQPLTSRHRCVHDSTLFI